METVRSKQDEPASVPKGLGWKGWLRWAWRQLTSMRNAIIMLLLLVIALIPASILPQKRQDPVLAQQWIDDNGVWGKILDAAGFFNILTAPWFGAIYILLFISLVGCIVPRSLTLVKDLKAGPGKVPHRLTRYESYQSAETDLDEGEAMDWVAKNLRGYRTRVRGGTLSAQKGYLREVGNVLFHMSLLGLLIVFGLSQALSYRGQAIIVEGETFANSVLSYDTFDRGILVNEESLPPYRVVLDEMIPEFYDDGTPSAFRAHVTIIEDGEERSEVVRPNEPIDVAGSNMYLSGNGYAPRIRITDADGNVAMDEYVVLPDITQDYISTGVIKVPDVTTGPQLGFQATLFPTAQERDGVIISVNPDALNPVLVTTTWTGDLGLDGGVPQNVYFLDTTNMELVTEPAGDGNAEVGVLTTLGLGQKAEIPGGHGTIEFVDLARFSAFDMRYDPTLGWMLFFAVLGLGSLAGSLLVPTRRVWVRYEQGTIHAAAIGRKSDEGLDRVVSTTLGLKENS
ncbi:cytochrome c biogenesis protein ResB [Flaviflexus massiliensis]|uniref:cytochrome c biogenesis protein ResB n=1 Tax=Flaviflexus massiliensis TaxID=1522309 RepID=UPI0006D59D83|nr:cytochrome c biogenesis protein ResB [Flaviflexus massiliensis]